MSNRKKYVAKLIKIEKLRKKRLAKKLKRARKLWGRNKDMSAKALSKSTKDPRQQAAQMAAGKG